MGDRDGNRNQWCKGMLVASEKPYDEGRDAACDGESKQPGEYDV